ncbi:DUF1178 family protein [Propionivibrio sp.]|uniref:DUF1178 family protein n=1 Tax=Propionivibrio sp. TaxID=2212460 RepID=UPI0025ED4E4F|nr:DUF1178 family protein [Propionivibrio sp.]MBK7356554.1 DUF1178 family protein [Propionivibrio sp.]MBK8400968.1 DUF1178 family protein [Propionivibrio sp.]MBK8744139.1 DUF1178 family protein [Propionivibrio sp.]MBK8894253.1 DUF1178 family protein [Propionivibrio sp.]MBL0207622.1 DUF1178 family protein [Propionivibrio sp.]
MIIFDLSCKQDHPFEGWFQSQTSYESQIAGGLVSCPQCGSTEIRRVPSVVHMSKQTNQTDLAIAPERAANMPSTNTAADLLATYENLLSKIVSNSEDVGKDFAEEARKIHYLEAPSRSILGEASEEDYESLREEGIEVMRLPFIKKSIN